MIIHDGHVTHLSIVNRGSEDWPDTYLIFVILFDPNFYTQE